MKKFIIDENAKILDKVEDGDRLKILREKSLKLLNRTVPWKIDYVKFNFTETMLVSQLLTNTERSFLFAVIPYTGYMDNCIRHINGKEIEFQDFIEISEYSRRTIYRILNTFSNKSILLKHKGKYFMNPWIASRGSRINKDLKNLFGEYFILTRGKKWSELDEKE